MFFGDRFFLLTVLRLYYLKLSTLYILFYLQYNIAVRCDKIKINISVFGTQDLQCGQINWNLPPLCDSNLRLKVVACRSLWLSWKINRVTNTTLLILGSRLVPKVQNKIKSIMSGI